MNYMYRRRLEGGPYTEEKGNDPVGDPVGDKSDDNTTPIFRNILVDGYRGERVAQAGLYRGSVPGGLYHFDETETLFAYSKIITCCQCVLCLYFTVP